MKIKKEILLDLLNYEESEGFEIEDEGNWVNRSKYDYNETIISYNDKFYLIEQSRSGSYHTDYYYDREDWSDEVECPEVIKTRVTKTVWKKVTNVT